MMYCYSDLNFNIDMMKLSAFRIKNFRSIVDTEWQNLSSDNITCLIGQNESGKTSVLEGLKAFYSGAITEDVLRSDLTLPEICCRFNVKKGWLLKITDNPGTELIELLSKLDHVELTRHWMTDFTSIVKVSGEIRKYLDSLENAWQLYLDEVETKLVREINEIKEIENKSAANNVIKGEIELKLSSGSANVTGFSLFRKRSIPADTANEPHIADLRKQLSEVNKIEEELKKQLAGRNETKKAGETYLFYREKLFTLDERLEKLSVLLEERHQRMTLLMNHIENNDDSEWEFILSDFRKTKRERDSLDADLSDHIAFSGNIMEGKGEEEARNKVKELTKTYRSQLTSEILGKKYFEFCPAFEMFEDFGSLLPNRIDMEDIISGNEQVEGYKAARNFLTIAQLDYSFFQQPSSRILKQKIENLNHNLTLNFQDFWQQSIGRNNKIRIQFELEHYNASYNEKAGKPYLEFWIKDEGERLYPKQRSRGVRWFLSFYMELKASAVLRNKPIVLLVDEPGVSLHARAQEDVLKVFEDIKETIQVIYTTHSPHLVDINKLHRVLAIQRNDIDSHRSNTRIFDPLRLSSATPDTLTPLQSIMGNPLTAEGFSSDRLNLIVNDIGTFYFLTALLHLTGFKGKISLIPSTEVSSIPLMCNILMGWGLRFAVILFSNETELKMAEHLKNKMFRTQMNESELVLMMPENILNSEDLISTLDFKTHILKSREGITVSNSILMKEKELPRNFLMSKFLSDVKSGVIAMHDLDEESVENFRMFSNLIMELK
jgi:ABC-type ATPase involved in cell division